MLPALSPGDALLKGQVKQNKKQTVKQPLTQTTLQSGLSQRALLKIIVSEEQHGAYLYTWLASMALDYIKGRGTE